MSHNIRELLELLDVSKFKSSDDWTELGAILYNIDTNLLDEFIRFTEKIDSNKKNECEKIWTSNLIDVQKSYVSCLIELVKRDNYDGYIKYVANYIVKKYNLYDTDLNSTMIDDIIYDIFAHEYIEIQGYGWYHYNGHMWRKIEYMQSGVRHDIHKKLYQIGEKMIDEKHNDGANISKKINKIVDYPNHLFKITKILGKPTEFSTIFDNNTNLLGFKNGVYDLNKNYFRIGYPSDYISKSTNYDYIEFTNDHEKIKELLDLLDAHDKNKFLSYAISCLNGTIGSVDVWYGGDGTGKTTLATLLSLSLGDYACVSSNFFGIKKRNLDHIGYKEYLLKGIRLTISEDNDKIDMNLLKNLSVGLPLSEAIKKINKTLYTYTYNHIFGLSEKKSEIDKKDQIYCNNIYGTDSYGKIINKTRGYMVGREFYGIDKIYPICGNILLIDTELQSINTTYACKLCPMEFKRKFDENMHINSKICNGDYNQVLMWFLLNAQKEAKLIDNLCEQIDNIYL